jgi:geranylgeranyl reductase family protein
MTGDLMPDPLRDPPGGRSGPRSAPLTRNRTGQRHDADAVIVGGGPAGAAAAARLAARGFTTILVDRATFSRDKVCGDFVGPAALAELADLGIAENEAFRATNKIRDGALHVDGDKLAARPLPQVDGLPSYGRVIPRLALDAWVLDAARRAGTTVLGGRKVTAIEQAPGAVTVRGHSAAGPWELRTRLLLGADGSNSIIARALRGRVPPSQDRILAVRAYFDHVGGPVGQADIYICSGSFPGYYWLFPAGGARANVGVGMVQSTYPHASRNLRELLLRLTAEDTAMRDRLRGARMDGKILGCPLTTYNPRLPLTGDRVMLVGDAAGLINPLNGEGIQYALQSARWAADVASDRLSSDQLDATSLESYEERVHQSLRKDMALSRFVVQIIRNRNLNPTWLRTLRIIAARARTDPDYADRIGCVLTGLTPATSTLGLSVPVKTAGQAIASARPGTSWRRRDGRSQPGHRAIGISRRRIGAAAGNTATARELIGWALGVWRALADLITQLADAKITLYPAGPHEMGPERPSSADDGPAARKDRD